MLTAHLLTQWPLLKTTKLIAVSNYTYNKLIKILKQQSKSYTQLYNWNFI